MKVFIDTSVFISYFIKQEAYHTEVVEKYRFYRKQRAIFLTSDYVLCELLTWISAKYHKSILEKLISFVQRMEDSAEINVLYIDKAVVKKSHDVLIKFSEHRLSFTDATTYVLYKGLALDEVFTLDDDFKKIRLNTSF